MATKATPRDPARRYTGTVGKDRDWQVLITEWGRTRKLPPRNDVRNHSPDGFAWGYGGSAPAQLALATLIDAIGVERATRNGLYHRFKFQRIATIPQDANWEMTAADVVLWANEAGAIEP